MFHGRGGGVLPGRWEGRGSANICMIGDTMTEVISFSTTTS